LRFAAAGGQLAKAEIPRWLQKLTETVAALQVRTLPHLGSFRDEIQSSQFPNDKILHLYGGIA
jgi:hypothetical protein